MVRISKQLTRKAAYISAALLCIPITIGCGRSAAAPSTGAAVSGGMHIPGHVRPSSARAASTHRLYRVHATAYDEGSQTVTLYATPTGSAGPLTADSFRRHGSESTIDMATIEGIVNFATAQYPRQTVHRVRVVQADSAQQRGFIQPSTRGAGSSTSLGAGGSRASTNASAARWARVGQAETVIADVPIPRDTGSSDQSDGTVPSSMQSGATHSMAANSETTPVMSGGSYVPIPPPGVRMDPNLHPLADRSASYGTKLWAVESVANSKLGTPYIWGHNEDRGQYGFDCSNFTEYVFHHALGYLFTTSSKGQFYNVGVWVNRNQMRPGDLLAFDGGGHVGIYVGNGQMIEEGGGLGKVGYLPVAPGSYWYNHLSGVKRLF